MRLPILAPLLVSALTVSAPAATAQQVTPMVRNLPTVTLAPAFDRMAKYNNEIELANRFARQAAAERRKGLLWTTVAVAIGAAGAHYYQVESDKVPAGEDSDTPTFIMAGTLAAVTFSASSVFFALSEAGRLDGVVEKALARARAIYPRRPVR